MNEPPIRLACVGAGYFSQFHYGSWARMTQVDLCGACDRDLEKAQATGAPAFDDLQRMLAEVKPDLLDIILPPEGHAEAIQTALKAGLKWIICQKPFCRDLAEARAMTTLAEQQGATIIIHENFRFQPWYRTLKTAMDQGAIGTPHQMTFRLRPGDGQGPRAYLDRQPYFQQMDKLLIHETGVHWVDTFRFLLGNPTSVYADLRRMNPVIKGEDAGIVVFEHAHNVRAIFDGNRHLDHAADNLRRTMGEALIEGTLGTLTLKGDGSVDLRAFHTEDTKQLLPPDTWDGFGGDCVHALQSHVVAAMRENTPLENTAPDYLAVVQIEEAIYTSAHEERKIRLDPL